MGEDIDALELTAAAIIEFNISCGRYISISIMFVNHAVANFNEKNVMFQIIAHENKMIFSYLILYFPENDNWINCSLLLIPMYGHDFIWQEPSEVF